MRHALTVSLYKLITVEIKTVGDYCPTLQNLTLWLLASMTVRTKTRTSTKRKILRSEEKCIATVTSD